MTVSEANQVMFEARHAKAGGTIPCSKCDKKFLSQKSLVRHMNYSHPSDDDCKVTWRKSKKFQCEESRCGYQTNNERAFINHKIKHQRFECEECEMSFPNKRKLKGHIRKCHDGDKKMKTKKNGFKAEEQPEWIQWIQLGLILIEDRTEEAERE